MSLGVRNLQSVLPDSFKRAIELEQRADTQLSESYLKSYSPKKLAKLGLAIVNLVVENTRTGLGGKMLIDLTLDPSLKKEGESLDSGQIKVGDIVKVDRVTSSNTPSQQKTQRSKDDSNAPELENSGIEGIVFRINSNAITISFEEYDSNEKLMNIYNNTANDSNRVNVVKLTNSVTYKRMISSLSKIKELNGEKKNDVIKYLLGESDLIVKPDTIKGLKNSDFFDKSLNESQKNAIDFAINRSPLSIIHGPPGTGKTYTLIELIRQLTFKNKERVLVCGPSNISVDTILERLAPLFEESDKATDKRKRSSKTSKKSISSDKLIRIGHPARLLPKNLKHCLDILSKSSFNSESNDNQKLLADVEKEIGSTLSNIKKSKRYAERRALWGELKDLKKELRSREKNLIRDLIINSKVVLSTLHGSGSYELTSLYKDDSLQLNSDNPLFDTIIIDEVSQSLEPQCWIPLISHLGFKRLVIAGDNMQLPPTIHSKDTIDIGSLNLKEKDAPIADLQKTLFDRIVDDLNGSQLRKLLDVQYRMNECLIEFASNELYESKLKTAASVASIKLTDIHGVEANDDTTASYLWYDTEGGDFHENVNVDDIKGLDNNGSKFNENEISILLSHLKRLIKCGVSNTNIGVITPYSAQVAAIKKALVLAEIENVEVSTVDGFQGREKEVIIISLVRSNDDREVGFLSDRRRLNVAMTRPKRQLCVIGDLELMQQCGVKYLNHWASYVEDKYELRYPGMVDL